MESPSDVFVESEDESLLTKQENAVKEQTLIVILGTLILCGWSLLGVIAVETSSSKFLRILNPDIATTVIFLVVIPSSIFLILARWISVAKTISFTTYNLLCFQLKFAKEIADNLPSTTFSIKQVITKLTPGFWRLKLAEKLFTATFFSFILAAVSGSVGFEKIEETNFLVFSLSCIVFSVQISRILAIAVNLVTTIQKAR